MRADAWGDSAAGYDAMAELWKAAVVLAPAPNVFLRAARTYQSLTAGWASASGEPGKCTPIPFAAFARDPAALVIQGGVFRCWGSKVDAPGGALMGLAALQPLAHCLVAGSNPDPDPASDSVAGVVADFLIRTDPPHALRDLHAAAALINERAAQQGLGARVAVDEAVVAARMAAAAGEAAAAVALYEGCRVGTCRAELAEFYRRDVALLDLAR